MSYGGGGLAEGHPHRGAGIADIARDRQGKGKTLPRINTDQEAGDRKKQNLSSDANLIHFHWFDGGNG